MRILIAAWNAAVIGGAEKYLQALIPSLLRRRHAVAMLYEVHPVSCLPTIVWQDGPVWFWEDQRHLPGLWQEIGAWKPDIVYSHRVLSLDLTKALTERYPSVLFAHDYLETCISGRKCHMFPQAKPCHRTFGKPCLALYYSRRCGGLNPLRAWRLYEYAIRRNSQLANYQAILVASTHLYREFEQHGVSSNKLHLVPLPVPDPAPYGPLRTPTCLPSKILFMGRLTDLKGVDYLIQSVLKASRQLGRQLELTIAGDGPQRVQLEHLATKLKVRVHFTGWIESHRKWDVLREADLLTIPSLWPEPFGLVGPEAGWLGIPAVGYAVGGITDWLIAGRSGELAPGDPPTVQGLADAIERALCDPRHHAQLSRGAWELSRQFTMEKHLARLEPILRNAGRAPVM
jgi:glycosyltransferase involved in cell wall biosynthesis